MSFFQPIQPMLSRQHLLRMGILFLTFIISAEVGRLLFIEPAVIQPAAGFALAGLVLGGMSLWPAIFAGSLLYGLLSELPILIIFSIVAAHTFHALFGAYILKQLGFDPIFRRVRDTFFFLFVAIIGSMSVPSIGFFGIEIHNLIASVDYQSKTTWLAWWTGVMCIDLFLGAALIRFFAKPVFTRTRIEIIELVFAFSILGILSYLVSWTSIVTTTNGGLILLFIIPFIWFSLRLGNRFTYIAFVMSSSILLLGVIYGGVPSVRAMSYNIISTEVFLIMIGVIFFLFSAVVEERKRAARDLFSQLDRVRSLLDAAREEDKAKSNFIAVFAHELRNPLAPIVSAVEMLKLRWGTNPEIADLVETIGDRTKTIVRLLDDLLDISRIAEGKLRLQKEFVELTSIIQKSILSIEPQIKAREQSIQISLPSDRVVLHVDPVRIEQVVNNLLSNASKFTPNKGTIEISTVPRESVVDIVIKDSGVGIEPAMLPRIFEPFVQVESSKRMSEGLGIGLSLTQKLLEVHGGTIEAKSDGTGKGSTFIASLPTAPPAPISTLIHHTTQPMSLHSNPLKILVVDDNQAAAQGLGTLLTHVGNNVRYAYVGADVPPLVAEFKPDVIVLDIGLPDMSGYEVAKKIRFDGFTGRIIALTGYGQEDDKKKAFEAGFDFHLTKPVGLADLVAALVPQTT